MLHIVQRRRNVLRQLPRLNKPLLGLVQIKVIALKPRNALVQLRHHLLNRFLIRFIVFHYSQSSLS